MVFVAESLKPSALATGIGVDWLTLPVVDSTNTYLLERLSDLKKPAVVIAQQQTAGRGRQGKTWNSEPGEQLMFSIYWPWCATYSPAALSLAVAQSLALCLTPYLYPDKQITVKWPNDLQIDGLKLAGILLETQSQLHCTGVVIGVGLNYALSEKLRCVIDQPVVSLQQCSDQLPSQATILSAAIDAVLSACNCSEKQGFSVALARWSEVDALQGQTVVVTQPKQQLCGMGQGIEPDGALRLQMDDQIQLIHSGTVRVV